jgi:hypothetical protein
MDDSVSDAETEGVISEAQSVAASGESSPGFMRWYLRSASLLVEVFGGNSKQFLFFRALRFRASGNFFVQGRTACQALRSQALRIDYYRYLLFGDRNIFQWHSETC